MSNLENLIEKILEDGRKQAQSIIEESEKNDQEIFDLKVSEANEKKNRIIEKANREAVMLKERMISEAELRIRDEKLNAKRQVLDKVFILAKERLVNIDEDTYMSFLKNSLNKNSLKGTEVLIVPDRFKEAVKKLGVYSNVSNNEAVESGFLLKDGNIIMNYSFKSLVDFRREDIEVEIAQELFQE